MYAPACSWRTGTNSIDESASDSFRSSVSSPGMPKTCLTPSASRHSTKTSDAFRAATRSPLFRQSETDSTSGAYPDRGASISGARDRIRRFPLTIGHDVTATTTALAGSTTDGYLYRRDAPYRTPHRAAHSNGRVSGQCKHRLRRQRPRLRPRHRHEPVRRLRLRATPRRLPPHPDPLLPAHVD